MVKPVSNRTKETGGGGDILGQIDELDDSNALTVNLSGTTTTAHVSMSPNGIIVNSTGDNAIVIEDGKILINGTDASQRTGSANVATYNGDNVQIINSTNVKVAVTRGAAKAAAAAAAKPKRQATMKKSNKKDIMADPRLKEFLERSKYEALVDPYRGLFPYFQLSFPVTESHTDGSAENESSNKDNYLAVDQQIFVDSNHPAIILSIDQEEKTAVVKYTTSGKEDTVTLDQISPMDSGTRSGKTSTIDTTDTTRQNEMAMDLDEKPSPWMKCSDALNLNSWEYTNPDGVEVINLDDTEEEGERKITLVKCGCSSVNEWAKAESDALEKERVAALKKKKRGKKGKKKKEVVIIDSDDEQQPDDVKKSEIEESKDVIICGRRGDGECVCDYNPFCLASIGGLFDEYRYNVAKTKQMLDSSNQSISDEDFAAALRANWSEMPSQVKKETPKRDGNNELKHIRSSIMVSKENVQTHILTYISTASEGELTAERCMDMLMNHHNLLILPSMQLHLTENNSNVQLSKPPGLKNLGATCYLNSQLQCLAQNLGFMHGLLSWKPTMPDSTDPRTLTTAKRMNDVLSSMQSILARMRYGHESAICTNEFSSALGLENDEMQDPNEVSDD